MDTAIIVALVGIPSAVVGSAVGSITTGRYSLRALREDHAYRRAAERDRERRATEREKAREDAAVRGIVRLLSAHLGEYGVVCKTALGNGRWWPEAVSLPPPLPLEDRKLLVTRLQHEQWVEVVGAEYACALMLMSRDEAGDERALNEHELGILEEINAQLQAGQTALGGVS